MTRGHDLFVTLGRERVLPVLTIRSAADATALRDGLAEGGLSCAEVTLRTEHAIEAIRIMSADGLAVGAGTVLTVDDAQRAQDAGAVYIVSPGTTPDVVEWCLANDVVVLPGVATPSEAMRVRDLGISTMKFFPASVAGGAAWLRAVAGPLPDLRFVATGGVTDATLPGYLAEGNLLAVGGSWFLPGGSDPLTAASVAEGVRAVSARVAEAARPAGGDA